MFKNWMMNLMSPLLQGLHITCKDTSPIISEMMDHRVSSGKYWRAKIHLSMCEVCRLYKSQLKVLSKIAQKLGQEDSTVHEKVALTSESKLKMKKILDQENQH